MFVVFIGDIVQCCKFIIVSWGMALWNSYYTVLWSKMKKCVALCYYTVLWSKIKKHGPLYYYYTVLQSKVKKCVALYYYYTVLWSKIKKCVAL